MFAKSRVARPGPPAWPGLPALLMIVASLQAAQDAALRFEVASVRLNTSTSGIPFVPNPPDGLRLTNYPLESIVQYAFGVQAFRVTGMPGWTAEEQFDIDARASAPITEEQRRLMLRTLLAERFDLRSHFETRTGSVYVLTTARADRRLGSGMKPRPDCETAKCIAAGSSNRSRGAAFLNGTTLDNLANGLLSAILGQVVHNESALAGAFDVQLSWRPDSSTDPNDGRPSFFTAVEEQLGLKLTPARRPVEMLVVDGISHLKPN